MTTDDARALTKAENDNDKFRVRAPATKSLSVNTSVFDDVSVGTIIASSHKTNLRSCEWKVGRDDVAIVSLCELVPAGANRSVGDKSYESEN